jgi:hypothetical protein
MPTEYWYPITSAQHDQPVGYTNGAFFQVVGGGNGNDAHIPGGGRAGPPTHDDATTYVRDFSNGAAADLVGFNIDWPSPMAVYTGNTFTGLGMRSRSLLHGGGGSTATRKFSFLDQVPQIGTYGTARAAAGTSAWFTDAPIDVRTGATYKPDGTAWDVSDFQDDTTIMLNGFFYDNGGGGHNSQNNVTSTWGTMEYEPPAGGYAFLLNLVGAAALPFVGRLTDFAQYQSFLKWRELYHKRHTKMTVPDELAISWADLQAYRWPTYFLPEVV